jgi:hypothetical protein
MMKLIDATKRRGRPRKPDQELKNPRQWRGSARPRGPAERGPGRPKHLFACPQCGQVFDKTTLRSHEPACRRSALKVGDQYRVKMAGRTVPVRIEAITEDGFLICTNLESKRLIRLKTPRRFEGWMDKSTFRFAEGHRLAAVREPLSTTGQLDPQCTTGPAQTGEAPASEPSCPGTETETAARR